MIDNVVEVLQQLDVKAGDHLLIYSNTASIAKVADLRQLQDQFGANARQEILKGFHHAFQKSVGEEGTLLTLGSYTDYARYGKPFHVDKSLPDQSLGAYPRYLFSQPGMVRSYNPISNLIALGRRASDIAIKKNATGYGLRTPWEKLVEYECKIVFWDTSLRPMTFGHHIEQCVGVPHVYSKIFDVPIYEAGQPIPYHAITSVRYLDFDIRYNMQRLEADLKRETLVKTFARNTLIVDIVECAALAEFLTEKLSSNPYYLLDSPPNFRKGVVPFDGNAGAENVRLSNVKYS
jgi:aminoglycoside 3-N-acetyltransferase